MAFRCARVILGISKPFVVLLASIRAELSGEFPFAFMATCEDLNTPSTASFCAGAVVPMPTLPD
jgi:hypothetical protein